MKQALFLPNNLFPRVFGFSFPIPALTLPPLPILKDEAASPCSSSLLPHRHLFEEYLSLSVLHTPVSNTSY